MKAARTNLDSLPGAILVGRSWWFADGSRLALVGGGDGPVDGELTVPEDLATLSDDDLAALEGQLVSAFDAHVDENTNDLVAMEAIADSLGRIRAENTKREGKRAEDAAKVEDLKKKVHAEDTDTGDEPGDGDDGDDPGDGAPVEGGDGEGANADDKEPVLVASGPVKIAVPAKRPASASGTSAQARRGNPTGQAKTVITAAADLPGFGVGQHLDLAQVAQAMHARARGLSNGSPRAEVVKFDVPNPHVIKQGMSADAQMAVLDELVKPGQSLKSLAAAGGWCTPSQIMYDLFDLTGQSGLLDLPTVTIERGGIQIPDYIGIDVADGALWTWSEDQDSGVALVISDLDASAGTATVTTADPHLLIVGDTVDINIGDPAVDGPHIVLSTPTATTFTFASGATVVSDSGTGTRQKGCIRIDCPGWTDTRLGARGLCITHGNLTDRAFPELTRRWIGLVMNAHQHRNSAMNIAIIRSSTHSVAVTPTATGTDAYGDVVSAVGLQIADYRSQHLIDDAVVIETLFPTWTRDVLRANLAMRNGVDNMLAVSNAQLDGYLATFGARPQWLQDYQPLNQIASPGTARVAWPTSLEFLMYPAGSIIQGNGGTIDLGVVRDSRLNATNDYTAAWTEDMRLVARRGPKGRKVTITITPDGKTGGVGA